MPRPRAAAPVTHTLYLNRLIRMRRAQSRSMHTRTTTNSGHLNRSDETRTNALSTVMPMNTDTHDALPITFLYDIRTSE
jgi:hypothetical protein